MLNEVKLALRLKSAIFDDEVRGHIAAAIDDLRFMGISVPDSLLPDETPPEQPPPESYFCQGKKADVTENSTIETEDEPPPDEKPTAANPRVKQAIILYCKGRFGYTAATDAERFIKAYDNLKMRLHFQRGRGDAVE